MERMLGGAGTEDRVPGYAPLLFRSITLRSLTLRNRIVVSPMCQYSSVDGAPTDWHLVHLGKMASGGAALVFTEETAVEAIGRKTYGCAGIWNDAHVKAYRRITNFIREQGAIPAIQLGHAGRKAACRPPWENFRPLTVEDAERGMPPWPPISSSPLPVSEGAQVPLTMDEAEIKRVVRAWSDAAQRSLDAGFEVVEVHGAHGYLIQQFLSPIVNRRTDSYGGDIEGRMRLALEIVEAVRAVWPNDRPVFFRISAVDGQGGHWDLEDSVTLAKALKDRGVDVVDCSSGGITGPLTMALVPRVPGYQVPYAARIREAAQLPTMAVGLITEGRQAEAVLQTGQADLIALGRELLRDPNWPVRAAEELGIQQPFDVLPAGYCWWLDRREKIRALHQDRAT